MLFEPVCFTMRAGPDPSLDTDNCSVVVTASIRKLEAVMDPSTTSVCAVVVPVKFALSIGALRSISESILVSFVAKSPCDGIVIFEFKNILPRICTLPFTSRSASGYSVPIPTFPSEVTIIRNCGYASVEVNMRILLSA